MREALVNAVVSGAAYALFALGFSCIYAVSRSFNFAQAGVYSIAAYVLYVAYKTCALPLWIGVALGIVGASILGGCIEAAVYRPLRRRGASSLTILLASLGVLLVLQNAISVTFGDSSRVVRGGELTATVVLGGVSLTTVRLATLLIAAIAVPVTWLLWRHTLFGKEARAVANDPELARVVGIDHERIILGTAVFGSVLASIAAMLQGFDSDLTPLMGFSALLMGVVATVVGGAGSIIGVALGGLLVGLAQHLAVWWLPGQWQDTVVFGVLAVFLIVRPTGFLGRPIKKVAM